MRSKLALGLALFFLGSVAFVALIWFGSEYLDQMDRDSNWFLPPRRVVLEVTGRKEGEALTVLVTHVRDRFHNTTHGRRSVDTIAIGKVDRARVPQAEQLPISVITDLDRGGYVPAGQYPSSAVSLRGGTCLSGKIVFPSMDRFPHAELTFLSKESNGTLVPIGGAYVEPAVDGEPFARYRVCGLCAETGEGVVLIATTLERVSPVRQTITVSKDCGRVEQAVEDFDVSRRVH